MKKLALSILLGASPLALGNTQPLVTLQLDPNRFGAEMSIEHLDSDGGCAALRLATNPFNHDSRFLEQIQFFVSYDFHPDLPVDPISIKKYRSTMKTLITFPVYGPHPVEIMVQSKEGQTFGELADDSFVNSTGMKLEYYEECPVGL